MATHRGTQARIGAHRVSSGEGRTGLPERLGGYQWRDPRRVGPGRLAELQAHDRKHAKTAPPEDEDTVDC
jgi:hypothetical protein